MPPVGLDQGFSQRETGVFFRGYRKGSHAFFPGSEVWFFRFRKSLNVRTGTNISRKMGKSQVFAGGTSTHYM